jgi:hypothetical protein
MIKFLDRKNVKGDNKDQGEYLSKIFFAER